CFIVLVATGVFLTFFFDASTAKTVYSGHYPPLNGSDVSSAYGSVVRLSFDIRMGLVIRQIHHWAAVVFIAAIVAHLCRIFFTSAFRRPREINWVLGMTLMVLSIFNGFTGYSLPDDLLSGVGLRIAYSIAISIPFIGPWMAFLVFGGKFGSPQIIGRLFIIHVLLFPAWQFRILGLEIPNVFLPAVVLPGITFGLLYAWPFIEAWRTGDHAPHHILDRPRDRPVRTALGMATLSFYAVLLFGGLNDLVAKWFQLPVESVTWTLRILGIVLPRLVGWLSS